MLRTLDLFAGAGGLSNGFTKNGYFEIVAAAEINSCARESFLKNHEGQIHMIEDVRTCDFSKLNEELKIDVVIGGPPCQGFSNANRQKNHLISMNNSLVKQYFRAIKEIKPKAFVMENVAMLASDTHVFFDSYIDHEEVTDLGVEMRQNTLVISRLFVGGVNVMDILYEDVFEKYFLPENLWDLLRVLYKNRKNESRKVKFIKKNKALITDLIELYCNTHSNIFSEKLRRINQSFVDDYDSVLEDLKTIHDIQKSLYMFKELIDNRIIFETHIEDDTIVAYVNVYSVIDYIEAILGTTYVHSGTEVNSAWYGVPQLRKRYIRIGIRSDIANGVVMLPEEPENIPVVSVGDAILDLQNYEATEEVNHAPITFNTKDDLTEYQKMMRTSEYLHNHTIAANRDVAKARFSALKEGENFHKLSNDLKTTYSDPLRTQNTIYLRLDSTKQCGTVVNVRKSMWIHPKLNRGISVREAARLQSFDDSFVFCGSKDSQFQQIGNAVPPLMAKGIADLLYKQIVK